MRYDGDDMSGDELLDAMGPADHGGHHGPQASIKQARPGDDLPSIDELNTEQYLDAISRLHEDARKFPRYPWPALADLAGPLCPQDLILVAARTGGGKSLFLQNLFDSLIEAGRCGIYVGLEQPPDTLRTKWACLRVGAEPRLMLAPKEDEYGTPRWRQQWTAVQDELKRIHESKQFKEAAFFSNARKINPKGLRAWTTWAVDRGAEFVIVDHVDRVHHGEGKNPFHEMSETIRLAKELAVEHRVVMLLATQVGRPSDTASAFMPVALHELRGGGTKEEEADTVLGAYRPLKAGTTDKQLKLVRTGLSLAETVVESGTMGVEVLKHRLDGEARGKRVKLSVYHGRVSAMPERDQYSTSRESLRVI